MAANFPDCTFAFFCWMRLSSLSAAPMAAKMINGM
jgi:hypothetical protein